MEVISLKKNINELELNHKQEKEVLKYKISAVLAFLGTTKARDERLKKENFDLNKKLRNIEKNYGMNIKDMTPRPDWNHILRNIQMDDIPLGKQFIDQPKN